MSGDTIKVERARLLEISRLIGTALYKMEPGELDDREPDIPGGTLDLLVASQKLGEIMYPGPRIADWNRERIERAAVMYARGASWRELDEAFGEAFCRDLRKPERYRDLFAARVTALMLIYLAGRHEPRRRFSGGYAWMEPPESPRGSSGPEKPPGFEG